MAVNIGEANAGDAFYRYKMPKLQARIEGRGNGIKTNVVNNVEIAKALERPPEYIIKFYGCELGAQTKYDKKSGTSIVNGAHDTGKLVELLESFIKKYVQCYSCGNPETEVKIRKENIFLKCRACGFVSDVDMRHRLNTFILKNPPEVKISKAEKKLKKMEKERLQEAAGENLDKEEKDKKKKKKGKKSKDKEDGDSPDGSGEDAAAEDDEVAAEEDVVWMTDTSAEAAKKRAAEQLTGATAAMVTQGNIEAEQAEADRKEKLRKKREAEEAEKRKQEEEARAAAEEARRKEEEEKRLAAEAARKLTVSGGLESEDPAAQVAALRDYIATHSAKDVALTVRKLTVEAGLAGRMRIFYEALFDTSEGGAKLAPQVLQRKAHLLLMAGDSTAQMAQLVAAEYLLGCAAPHRVRESALLLKALYDEDIVDEQLIVAWAGKLSAGKVLSVPSAAAKAVRDAAAPFIDWLKTEEESDEESEEED